MAHILVVDDDTAMLQLVRRVLEKDQHLVTLQSNAKAVTEMDFSKFGLILLDVMMPEIDGFDLCNQIRDRVDCPIIFLTAKTQESEIVQGLGLGADDYITKPFGTNELIPISRWRTRTAWPVPRHGPMPACPSPVESAPWASPAVPSTSLSASGRRP